MKANLLCIFFKCLGWGMIIVAFFGILFVRLKNADMSETRLFIEYLPLWLVFAGLVLGGASILSDLKYASKKSVRE